MTTPWMSVPWKAFVYEKEFTSHVRDSEGDMLADRLSASQARLISAAPDLLEALKEMLDCSPCRNGCEPDNMICASNLARAAIQKAEPK